MCISGGTHSLKLTSSFRNRVEGGSGGCGRRKTRSRGEWLSENHPTFFSFDFSNPLSTSLNASRQVRGLQTGIRAQITPLSLLEEHLVEYNSLFDKHLGPEHVCRGDDTVESQATEGQAMDEPVVLTTELYQPDSCGDPGQRNLSTLPTRSLSG